MDWLDLGSYFDTVDLIMITLITVVGGYFYWKYRSDVNDKPTTNGDLNTLTGSSVSSTQNVDTSFLGRMKSEDRQVQVLALF